MIGELMPDTGRLLLAEPLMLDPNFRRSVVYLTEHNELGSIGFVLNQRSVLSVKDLIEDVEVDMSVYIGGPVENNTLHYIHSLGDEIDSSTEISEGVFWGGNFETVKLLLNNHYLNDENIRFFVGYSGWSPDQLEYEMEENAWLVAESKPGFIFHQNDAGLWMDVVRSLGDKYAHIVNFPIDPNLN